MHAVLLSGGNKIARKEISSTRTLINHEVVFNYSQAHVQICRIISSECRNGTYVTDILRYVRKFFPCRLENLSKRV